jgi:glycosyltransferase involved in cell wall biosynthesis
LTAKLARRCFYQGVWLPRAMAALVNAVHRFRPDAVLTSGPPHCVHLLGLFLKHCFHLPWAVDLRDPWFTGGARVEDWFPWPRWEEFWEKRVVRHADCLIANTPLGRQLLQTAYPRHAHKLTVITNGFDPEFFPQPQLLQPLNERLTIVHAGEVYSGRDPRPFFDALRMLQSKRPAGQPPIRVRLLGQSTENRFDLRDAIAERDLGDVVELGGQVPYGEALDAMTKADLLLLFDTPGRKISIPAKLFEYLGAARPILALTESDGDTAWALRTSGMPHRIVPPLDAPSIAQALGELHQGLVERSLPLPYPTQLAAFTRARLAADLSCHLEAIVGRKQVQRSLDSAEKLDSGSIDVPQDIPATAPAGSPRYAGA